MELFAAFYVPKTSNGQLPEQRIFAQLLVGSIVFADFFRENNFLRKTFSRNFASFWNFFAYDFRLTNEHETQQLCKTQIHFTLQLMLKLQMNYLILNILFHSFKGTNVNPQYIFLQSKAIKENVMYYKNTM